MATGFLNTAGTSERFADDLQLPTLGLREVQDAFMFGEGAGKLPSV